MDQFEFVAAVGIPSLILALWRGRVWGEKNPDKLGFKWGFFVIFNALITNILIFGSLAYTGIEDGSLGIFALGTTVVLLSSVIGYLSVQRNRWAILLSTIFSFNLAWIIINIFYLKGRWPEFLSEAHSRASSAERENHMHSAKDRRTALNIECIKRLPKDVRVAIFVVICWSACVLSYAFLAEPYGRYITIDDFAYMLEIIFIPAMVGLGLFFIYRRFVR
ncbi:hypothetical protein IV417_13300 [Alphaproteobacteria bacterium KMM 3653]|uniref:Uncharacterized protein n=1 Tax=Harenicola maris TaxID=2841044 RepID=A0AAP2G8W5_9RHOB|nr:hypothetical protein [Harenicola maris]